MSREGQCLKGRYQILSLEGEGGMAAVYKAQDTELQRLVAVKVFHPTPDAGDAFRREARAAARLSHPNIVAVYDVGQDDNVDFIVMEYVQGQSLKDLIESGAPLGVGRALDIAIQVCEAVGFTHKQGIIHCDVKPQNVLVLPDGKVKVTDFGIAQASSATTGETGQVWGTPSYAAPELVSGDALTPATDVYAIGVMLYEMLSSKLPFNGKTVADIARQHVASAPPPIRHHNPRIPRYVEQIVDRALSKNPAARHQTARQLGKLLSAYRQRGAAVTQPLPQVRVRERTATDQPVEQPTAVTAEATPARPRVDWLMLLLAGLAFLSVMGLLPLWGAVIGRALGQPTPEPATPTVYDTRTPFPTEVSPVMTSPPRDTPTSDVRVSVPDLVNQEIEEARKRAEDAGLALTVNEERHDSTIPAAHVIAQSVRAGEQAPRGSEIRVVVSLGPELVTMPDVIGFPAAVKRLDLEDIGLTVALTETWSHEPIGLIVDQAPEAGTEISAGSTVTLTVSSGASDQVEANLDDKVLLAACEFNGVTFRPGDAVQILITWQVLDRMSERYTLFVHIIDADGHILTQKDEPPLGGSRPTDTWRPGEKLLDPHTLTLPHDAPLGTYSVRLGLYHGSFRLPVIDPGLAEVQDDAIIVRQITLQSN